MTEQSPSPLGEGRGGGESFVRTFPCASCGAKLSFAPGTRTLKCEHCGAANEIEGREAEVEELDFQAYVAELEGQEETFEQELVRCTKCGAEQHLPGDHFAAHCAFCGVPVVSKGYAKRQVKPRAMIPFQVTRSQAQEAFRKWVRGLWLAPGELKRMAQADAAMTGTYLPFWTYDCRTASDYAGERGEDYWATETYTSKNASGRPVTQTRQVKRTNWSPASGHVERFHDDVLVMASESLPHSLRGATLEWNLKALVPYQPEYVSNYRAEAYRVGLKDGYPIARHTIDAQVHDAIRRDIGGDQQRVHQVSTRYDEVKFKHLLLPVWLSAYRFGDKTYRFVVNGQTGDVAGESPVSWQKATMIAIGVIIWVIFLIWLFR
jgi:LSD1 subclass zinc finger protein